jgi:hypothetical protein
MTDIHHRIGVESPSTDDVYAALTTLDGLLPGRRGDQRLALIGPTAT